MWCGSSTSEVWPPMRSLVVLQIPKSDHTSGYCEDAWSIQGPEGTAFGSQKADGPTWHRLPRSLRVALSDGASTSSGAELWASLLSQGATTFAGDWEHLVDDATWFEGCRSAWKSQSEDELGTDAPWYARAAQAMGAYATLLALRIDEATWKALAVGDTNLFQVREGRLFRAFPVEQVASFDEAPSLVSSLACKDRPGHTVHLAEGILGPGDVLILATDAMARFLMEQGAWTWALSLLEDPAPEASFLDVVQKGRATRQLKDDDTTLSILRPSICSTAPPSQDCPPATTVEC